jgi:multidrug efflux system membrane fusion protein
VQRGAPGTYVYQLNPDNTVAVRPIRIGPADGERTLVESGIEPGAIVVVDGADRLREGARVTVPGAQRAGDGATPPQPGRGRQGGGQRGQGGQSGSPRPAP